MEIRVVHVHTVRVRYYYREREEKWRLLALSKPVLVDMDGLWPSIDFPMLGHAHTMIWFLILSSTSILVWLSMSSKDVLFC